MEIRWLGHACFAVTHEGYTVVIDPYDFRYTAGYPELKVKADKLLISHEHYGHNCRRAVQLSGKPESACPFTVTTLTVDHDTVGGIMRGTCLVHILEADGRKIAHMSDIGGPLTGGDISRLFGADAVMVTAGSCTGLPSQEVRRMTDEIMPTAIIPMHYRFGTHGARRLEHLEQLESVFEAPGMFIRYPSDTLVVDENLEPQIAVLKYMGD